MKREIIKSIYWILPALMIIIFGSASGIQAQTETSILKGEISTTIPGGDTVNLSGAKIAKGTRSLFSPTHEVGQLAISTLSEVLREMSQTQFCGQMNIHG